VLCESVGFSWTRRCGSELRWSVRRSHPLFAKFARHRAKLALAVPRGGVGWTELSLFVWDGRDSEKRDWPRGQLTAGCWFLISTVSLPDTLLVSFTLTFVASPTNIHTGSGVTTKSCTTTDNNVRTSGQQRPNTASVHQNKHHSLGLRQPMRPVRSLEVKGDTVPRSVTSRHNVHHSDRAHLSPVSH